MELEGGLAGVDDEVCRGHGDQRLWVFPLADRHLASDVAAYSCETQATGHFCSAVMTVMLQMF